MEDYTKLVEALRHCSHDGIVKCNGCEYDGKEWPVGCMEAMMRDAAAAIEALLSFAHYVAEKVTMSDEDWEDYHEAFTEVACRKLVKLGVISIEDDMYVYRRDEPQEVQDGQA